MLILLCAIILVRYLSCSIFEGWLAPWTTNMYLDRLDFLKVLATLVTLFWQTGQRGGWQVIWCHGSHQIVHDVRCLCISTIWLFNFVLPRTKGNLTIIPSFTTKLSCISSSSLLFPFISSSSSSPSFFPYFRRFGRPPGPSYSPVGTCRTGTGTAAYRSGLLLPQDSK